MGISETGAFVSMCISVLLNLILVAVSFRLSDKVDELKIENRKLAETNTQSQDENRTQDCDN